MGIPSNETFLNCVVSILRFLQIFLLYACSIIKILHAAPILQERVQAWRKSGHKLLKHFINLMKLLEMKTTGGVHSLKKKYLWVSAAFCWTSWLQPGELMESGNEMPIFKLNSYDNKICLEIFLTYTTSFFTNRTICTQKQKTTTFSYGWLASDTLK